MQPYSYDMRKYILSIFTLILILTTVSAQEQTVTATNDTTPALTKKELRKQRVARRNFHYNILGGPSYTPDFGALIGGSALMTFRMNPSDTTQLRSVLPMSIAYMFKGGVNLMVKPQLFFKGDRFRIFGKFVYKNTEDNKESLYEIHFSLTNKVGFDQTDNYLDPNAQLGTQIEMNQAPTGIGWNNIEARRWLVDYYKREQTTDGKNDSRLFHTLWYDGAAADFPEYPNQLIYGSPWNSDWGNRVFIKKYSTDASPLYYWNDNNFRSLRYADMLLLYAETLNELNSAPPSKAIECLNRVRNRVNLPDIEDSKYYNGSQISTNKDAFREHLKIERALELAMECVRWIDLKRWGINDQAALNELKERDSDFNNFIIGKSIRMPIPQSEVDNNPNLNQNDQY